MMNDEYKRLSISLICVNVMINQQYAVSNPLTMVVAPRAKGHFPRAFDST